MREQGPADAANGPIRVLVADDQTIVRKGIRALLAEVEDVVVVGEASNGQEAVIQAQALNPDVTLMDLAMPVMDGIEAIRQITAHQAGARILVLTSFTSDDKVFPAIKAGALGYLLKDSEPADLIRAIEQVSRGEPSLHPSIAIQVLQELRRPAQQTRSPERADRAGGGGAAPGGQGAEQSRDRRAIDHDRGHDQIPREQYSESKLHLANRVQATLYALQEGATLAAGHPRRHGIKQPGIQTQPSPIFRLIRIPTLVTGHRIDESNPRPPDGGLFILRPRSTLLPMASDGWRRYDECIRARGARRGDG